MPVAVRELSTCIRPYTSSSIPLNFRTLDVLVDCAAGRSHHLRPEANVSVDTHPPGVHVTLVLDDAAGSPGLPPLALEPLATSIPNRRCMQRSRRLRPQSGTTRVQKSPFPPGYSRDGCPPASPDRLDAGRCIQRSSDHELPLDRTRTRRYPHHGFREVLLASRSPRHPYIASVGNPERHRAWQKEEPMVRTHRGLGVCIVVACTLLLPPRVASAQQAQASGIAGVVKDTRARCCPA